MYLNVHGIHVTFGFSESHLGKIQIGYHQKSLLMDQSDVSLTFCEQSRDQHNRVFPKLPFLAGNLCQIDTTFF